MKGHACTGRLPRKTGQAVQKGHQDRQHAEKGPLLLDLHNCVMRTRCRRGGEEKTGIENSVFLLLNAQFLVLQPKS